MAVGPGLDFIKGKLYGAYFHAGEGLAAAGEEAGPVCLCHFFSVTVLPVLLQGFIG